MTRVGMPERKLKFSDLKRFVEKVEVSPDGCWIWKGSTICEQALRLLREMHLSGR